jgi:hypothetical protein
MVFLIVSRTGPLGKHVDKSFKKEVSASNSCYSKQLLSKSAFTGANRIWSCTYRASNE